MKKFVAFQFHTIFAIGDSVQEAIDNAKCEVFGTVDAYDIAYGNDTDPRLDVIEATPELVEQVKADRGASSWIAVDGIAYTEKQGKIIEASANLKQIDADLQQIESAFTESKEQFYGAISRLKEQRGRNQEVIDLA